MRSYNLKLKIEIEIEIIIHFKVVENQAELVVGPVTFCDVSFSRSVVTLS